MSDTASPSNVSRNYGKSALFGLAVGVFNLGTMWGMEHSGISVMEMVFGFFSLVGIPGVAVSVVAALFFGNVHDPNIYIAAIANTVFYGCGFHLYSKYCAG